MAAGPACAFFCLVSIAWCQSPVPVITGPSAGVVGDFIELSSSDSVATATAWTVIPAELPDGRMSYRVYDNGRTLIVANYPGRYVVILAAASADAIAVRQHIVTVSAGPGPGPEPKPPGPDKPVDPEPKPQTLADQVADWATPAAGRDRLAAAFDGTAASAAAGAIRTVEDMQRASLEANRAALGDDREAWLGWFGLLQAELQKRAAAGTLKTLDEHVAAWRQIAAGIRRAGN